MEIHKNKFKPGKRRKGIYLIPNLITTGNIFCGYYAIISAINGQYYSAAVAIMIAMVFDLLDGKIARLTNTSSDFGLNYDSLADVISFGIAPSLLVYLWVLKPFGRIGWMAVFLFLICGALRLARFNSQASFTKNIDFVGLPIPAAAGVVASSVIMVKDIFSYSNPAPIITAAIVYILAFLMVSNFKYKSFKKIDITEKKPFNILIFSILLIYIVAAIPQIMLFVLTLGYALSGPFLKILSYKKRYKECEVLEVKE